jgi:hypothetical protein
MASISSPTGNGKAMTLHLPGVPPTTRPAGPAAVVAAGSAGRIPALFSALLRVCGGRPRFTARQAVSFVGAAAAVGLLGFLFVLQVIGIVRCPYYGPASCVEESAYTYTSSRNYLRLGLLNSGMLQDFCNSPDPRDHPFVYDHMPAGPDLLLAGLLRATGESYRAARVVLAVGFLAGMWFYLRFCQLILARLRLPGAGLVLFLLPPWTLIQGMERLIYNLYPLLAFAPFVALASFYRTGRRRSLWAAALVAFVSSFYLEYSLLSAVIASWVFVYVTGLLELRRRHLVLVLGCIALGIGLHLLQNMLYLGPQTFFRELAMTLGNRVAGVPTQQQLSAFYRSLGLVHHGSHSPRLGVLWRVVLDNFKLPQRRRCLAVAALGLMLCLRLRLDRSGSPVFRLSRPGRGAARYFTRLWLWIAATVVTPILLFPAFAQEVNLRGSGANHFYLTLGLYALVAFGVRQVFVRWPIAQVRVLWASKAATARVRHCFHLLAPFRRYGERGPAVAAAAAGAAALALCACLLAAATGLLGGALAIERDALRDILGKWRNNHYADLQDLKRFAGELYVTNINTPTVGFFTEAPGYGVCGPETITADGAVDKTQCKIAFMRRADLHDQQPPRYFFYFWSKELFPGFADVLPSGTLCGENRGGDELIEQMQDRLDTHFAMIYENRLFRVYDLRQRPTPSPGSGIDGAAVLRPWKVRNYKTR